MRISDWSSDVCSSDLADRGEPRGREPVGFHDSMAEFVAETDEVAFGVDDDLLDDAGALFEQPTQRMCLTAAAIALDQQARGQQFLKVDIGRLAQDRKSTRLNSSH